MLTGKVATVLSVLQGVHYANYYHLGDMKMASMHVTNQ